MTDGPRTAPLVRYDRELVTGQLLQRCSFSSTKMRCHCPLRHVPTVPALSEMLVEGGVALLQSAERFVSLSRKDHFLNTSSENTVMEPSTFFLMPLCNHNGLVTLMRSSCQPKIGFLNAIANSLAYEAARVDLPIHHL